ncbi:MAG: LysM peptidoglycan-binding domain-containing protein [Phycisphaerales bacterium]|nr:LysM peptidoglycan-binding domain-containing protein [Phycisphaerales bacterium]
MTREHKLSLVLGFGLLLFVGILLSDHFSAAQRREHADLANSSPARSSRALTDPITIQALPAAVRVATSTVGQYSSDGSQADGLGLQPYVGAAPVVPAPPAVPAELYTIKAGESLYKICQAKYGDGSLWKSLAEFNSNVIPNPTKLRAGVTIRLPAESVLRGEVPQAVQQVQFDVPGMSAGDNATLGTLQQPEPAAPATREYTVQKGDTLTTIASKKLGSKSKWKQIADANRDRLNDPHNLVPGTVIRLPN